MKKKTQAASKSTAERLVRRLRQLEKEWPEGYWLFAASGTLCLMREKSDGRATGAHGGMDPDDIVASFDGIPNDGGDW